ncbi:hypothetical protein M9458_014395, partial [Cirrhinus mrigala]
ACEDMPLSLLQSRAAFFMKKPRLTSTASYSGPSTSGYEAAAMCVEGEQGDMSDVLLGTSPQTACPACSPVELSDDFDSSSQYGLDLLFEAPAEGGASEGGRELSEADVLSELAAPAAKSQSVADAEMAAALQRAARETGLELDDWFLGNNRDSRPRSSPVPFFPEVHKELTKSWKARAQYTNSSSLTTLEADPARGYTEVPQVERAIAMHLCPQNAASWRGHPKLPSRACKFSSALVAKAYMASGQAASALHAMAIRQVYQAKVLKDLHKGIPNPGLLQELRSANDYALRLTKVTAQALGRTMSTMVIQERHLWLNLAEMRDAEKVRFLDALISQAGLFGETVEEFAQEFFTVKKQTEAIKHIPPRVPAQLRRGSSPHLLHAEGGPLRERLRPRRRPVLQLDLPNGPALAGRPQRTLVRLQSIPETGSPGKEDCLTGDERWIRLHLGHHMVDKRAISSFYGHYSQRFRPSLRWPDAVSSNQNMRSHTSCVPPYNPPQMNVLNRALLKLPFKMLTLKHILTTRTFMSRFFQDTGRTYGLPLKVGRINTRFFPSASPCHPASLQRKVGIRILNYLDNWLILAHSRDLVYTHRDVVLNLLARLGLRVNWEKNKVSPAQSISFHSVELDSVSMSARLSPEHAHTQTWFQRLLGHMASSAAVPPLGLMDMRPLQHWLHTRVPRWAWRRGTYRVNITPSCLKTLSPWQDISFLLAGVPLEQVSRCIIVTTDASKTGWGAVCNRHAASGVWTGPRLLWHINCLELLTVLLALRRFQPLIQGKHMLVRSDNTATVAYINHQGGVRSFRMSQLAHHFLLWSQHRLRSLRATHIPGDSNCVADSLSRQASLGGKWRLHSHWFGQAQVDLFASPESTHCQLWYGLTEAPLGIDVLAHSWPRDLLNLIAQTLCKVREGGEQFLLEASFWPNRTCISSSLAHPSEEGPPLSGEGHNLAPAPRPLEPPPLVPGHDQEGFRDLSPSVVNTLLQARAPST